MAIGAILTQNTAWKNVEIAISNLRAAHLLSAQALDRVSPTALEVMIRPSGYFRQKTKKIKGFSHYLVSHYEGDLLAMKAAPLSHAREELLSIKGIGPETADSILLYALDFPIFVIDAYTVRMVDRWLGREPGSWTYEELQTWFMDRLPPDSALFNEYHALLVRHAKERCTKRDPKCPDCSLREECKYGELCACHPEATFLSS